MLTLRSLHVINKLYEMWEDGKKTQSVDSRLTLVVVDVTPVLSELSELPATVFTLPLQVLLHSALFTVRGLLHVSPEQSLLKKLLPAHITPEETQTQHDGPVRLTGSSAESLKSTDW